MKKIFIVLLFMWCIPLLSVPFSRPSSPYPLPKHASPHPLLVVTLMVKNEEQVIRKTLEPFVNSGVDAFLVYDTGSTDKTVDVVKNYFKEKKVTHGSVFQEPFVDFATSRNRALELTHRTFPHAAFIVMPDAEWYINDVPGLLHFCRQEVKSFPDVATAPTCYLLRVHLSSNEDMLLQRLIRCHTNAHFVGAVHEYIETPASRIGNLPPSIYFNYAPTDAGKQKTDSRLQRDKQILMREYKKNPHNFHTLFFLGQTCQSLKEFAEAQKFYTQALNYAPTDTARFMIFYQLGIIADRHLHNWQSGRDYYLAAYNAQPHRIEPLIRIADYYRAHKQPLLAYQFARATLDIPYPTHAEMVDTEIYTLYRYELVSDCAYAVGDYKGGLWATEQALKEQPHNHRLHKQLAQYKQLLHQEKH